ncbi:MAG: glucose-1-phosphate cytidylyltransferase, partial [Elusimicrobia bacterium]|nr:glucose-1-phosphate cytidylyltransferase [Elusimicrobiota bacterium]
FGVLQMKKERVTAFREKVAGDEGWINGGFMVVEPEALDGIEGDATRWEGEPLSELARRGRVAAYRHRGFWHPMDTLRDKLYLDDLWAAGRAPWKVWP